MNYKKVIDWLDEDDAEFIYSSLKIDNLRNKFLFLIARMR